MNGLESGIHDHGALRCPLKHRQLSITVQGQYGGVTGIDEWHSRRASSQVSAPGSSIARAYAVRMHGWHR